MKATMATRNLSNAMLKCTAYVLHKSQQPIFDGIQKSIIDFSEHKLKRCIKNAEDFQKKHVLTKLLDEYKDGEIAIAWLEGRPQWLKVTHEKLGVQSV